MEDSRGNDVDGHGRPGHCPRANQRFKIDGDMRSVAGLESVLELIPVVRIGKQYTQSLRSFLAQSLQDEDIAAAAWGGQHRDVGIFLAG